MEGEGQRWRRISHSEVFPQCNVVVVVVRLEGRMGEEEEVEEVVVVEGEREEGLGCSATSAHTPSPTKSFPSATNRPMSYSFLHLVPMRKKAEPAPLPESNGRVATCRVRRRRLE